MRITRCQRSHAAFSSIELLVVIVTLMLLFVVFGRVLPGGGNRVRSARIGCVSRLKQVGLAARMWSNDHEDRFPWAVSTNKGGTLEYAASAEVFRHFVAISNEVSSPKVLVCATDRERLRATTFATPLANSNLSYFVGLDADETRPQTILSGDRNIVGGVSNGAWLVFRTTNAPAWTRELHNLEGNVALGDGSVGQFTSRMLSNQFQSALITQTNPVIRLAIPRTREDEARSFSSSGLSRPLLGAMLGAVVLALWIVVRRGLLAASGNAVPPKIADASNTP